MEMCRHPDSDHYYITYEAAKPLLMGRYAAYHGPDWPYGELLDVACSSRAAERLVARHKRHVARQVKQPPAPPPVVWKNEGGT